MRKNANVRNAPRLLALLRRRPELHWWLAGWRPAYKIVHIARGLVALGYVSIINDFSMDPALSIPFFGQERRELGAQPAPRCGSVHGP